EGEDTLFAQRVVVAAGLEPFPFRPPEFEGLPGALASHSMEHRDFSSFAGQRVAVIGGGQSAMEAAAFLNEAGAEVESIVRATFIRWIRLEGATKPGVLKSFYIFLMYPPTDVGPKGWNWIVATPDLYRTASPKF